MSSDTPQNEARIPEVRSVDPGSVHVLYEPRATRVVLTGEIDAELGPELLEAAEDALTSGRPLQVDAHHVTFMDSTGLAFLARLASRSRGRRVTLIRPPAVVKFLIETTNIIQLLDVVEDETPTDDDEPRPA
ncbi:STAS domain-containing protein [Kineococcus gynurae]|uniref:STAS domain-containing protein n=1 Tax=Kineococcus gynurae TaxID=452979 RepID=A0ABV5LS60_9ACTN